MKVGSTGFTFESFHGTFRRRFIRGPPDLLERGKLGCGNLPSTDIAIAIVFFLKALLGRVDDFPTFAFGGICDPSRVTGSHL